MICYYTLPNDFVDSKSNTKSECMITITEDFVRTIAVNSAALNKGKQLANTGMVVAPALSHDGLIYWGECRGSGKKN